MGRFSFTRAEYTPGGIANLTYGDKYRILVPEKFGGGYILDKYSKNQIAPENGRDFLFRRLDKVLQISYNKDTTKRRKRS